MYFCKIITPMKCEIVKLDNLSGHRASVYSLYLEEEGKTLFDRFIADFFLLHKSEISNIVSRLKAMGHKTGIRESFFKKNEGAPGDQIWAFYDIPNSKIRLYIIYFNLQLIIVGGGGPKNVRALQEDKKLKSENYFLRGVSRAINERIRSRDIIYINNGMDLEGELKFDNIKETK